MHYRNYEKNERPTSVFFVSFDSFFRPKLQPPISLSLSLCCSTRLDSTLLDVARHIDILPWIALPDEPLPFDRSSPVDPASRTIKRSRLASSVACRFRPASRCRCCSLASLEERTTNLKPPSSLSPSASDRQHTLPTPAASPPLQRFSSDPEHRETLFALTRIASRWRLQ